MGRENNRVPLQWVCESGVYRSLLISWISFSYTQWNYVITVDIPCARSQVYCPSHHSHYGPISCKNPQLADQNPQSELQWAMWGSCQRQPPHWHSWLYWNTQGKVTQRKKMIPQHLHSSTHFVSPQPPGNLKHVRHINSRSTLIKKTLDTGTYLCGHGEAGCTLVFYGHGALGDGELIPAAWELTIRNGLLNSP